MIPLHIDDWNRYDDMQLSTSYTRRSLDDTLPETNVAPENRPPQ